jgi:integrase
MKKFEYPATPAGLDSAAAEQARRRHDAGVPLDAIRDRGFAERPEPPLPPEQWIEFPLPEDDNGPKFTSDRGGLHEAAKELPPSNVRALSNVYRLFWTPLQIKCGLTDENGGARYGFHMLRHAAASLFIAYLGWTPKRVQTVMGHSSITMTYDLYGHMFENKDSDREAMQKIEAAITAA